MPTMTDTDSILLAVAAFLFAFAVIALIAWAFKTFMLTGRSGSSFLKGRERRLGVVESAAVDGHRKLILIRRDNVEHLIMTGGPVDVVIETGIEGTPASRACRSKTWSSPGPNSAQCRTLARPDTAARRRKTANSSAQNGRILALTVTLSQRWFCLSGRPSCARQDLRTYGRHVLLWQADDVTPVESSVWIVRTPAVPC